jgi:putative component of membrane protein insertase Oxa1/YidC/SpoIIIJ protein YidD
MGYLALKMIGFYQQRISSHKGYCCAYRFQTGRLSCSHFAARAIRRCGIFAGLRLMLRRFRKCSDAYLAASDPRSHRTQPRHARYQTGNCDLSLDGCDLSPDNCTMDNCSPDLDDCFTGSCPRPCNLASRRKKPQEMTAPQSPGV